MNESNPTKEDLEHDRDLFAVLETLGVDTDTAKVNSRTKRQVEEGIEKKIEEKS